MTEPVFGHRGLKGPPIKGPPLGRPPEPPQRMRSHVVAVGGIGVLALLLLTANRHRGDNCEPPDKDHADPAAQSCVDHSYSSGGGGGGGGGHAYSGGGGSAHAAFGGFGGAAGGHGGGE